MQDIKLMEWQEEQFLEHASSILRFGSLMNYSHKIKLADTDLNVYLVSEEFYLKVIKNNTCT